MLQTRKRGQAQLEDSQDDEDNSGDEAASDGETDGSPYVVEPKSARSDHHTSKRTKRVSGSTYQPVNGVMTDTSLSQSINSNQHQEQKGSVQDSYSPQALNLEDSFAEGLHQNTYAATQQTQMLSDHGELVRALAASRGMQIPNQQNGFQSGSESGNLCYGDNSTGGSDSEGLAVLSTDSLKPFETPEY